MEKIEEQYKAEHFGLNYDTKERFIAYWYQIHEIISKKPKFVIEVGVGNCFLSNYLRAKGIDVVGIDISKSLEPDIIGNITALPVSDETADVVACFQTLEHISFDYFETALAELARISKNYVIISIPHLRNYTYYKIPRIGIIVVPTWRNRWRKLPPEHHWEIGKPPATIKYIRAIAQNIGLKIEKDYHIPEYPYHHIFRFKK